MGQLNNLEEIPSWPILIKVTQTMETFKTEKKGILDAGIEKLI